MLLSPGTSCLRQRERIMETAQGDGFSEMGEVRMDVGGHKSKETMIG